ncbi:MAG: DUF2207 domain-containing protein [Actinobacteria bacterium]|nr:DUF2207 domain-containing protein [Actinomycetota bacterium]
MPRESVAHEVGLAMLVILLAGGAVTGALIAAGGRLPEPPLVQKILGQDAPEVRDVDVTATMEPSSLFHVRQRTTFADGDEGVITLERPCPNGQPAPFACILNPRLNGASARFTERAARTEITAPSGSVVEYDLSGAVSGYSDIGVLEWPVLPRPFASTNDGFDLAGTITFTAPDGAVVPGGIRPHLHGVGPSPAVPVEGNRVEFAGRVDTQLLDVSLDVAFPIGLVPQLSDLRRSSVVGRTIFETTQSFKDRADTAVDTGTRALALPRKILRYVVLGVGFGIPALLWVAVAVTVVRRVRYRRLTQRPPEGPEFEEEPPSAHDPGLVALLHAEGKPPRAAVAGAILHLAARGELDVQDLAGDAFTLAVMPDALGTSAGDSLLLATLRTFAAEEGGRISGPPLFKRPVGLWRSYRRDVIERAQQEGLVRRVVSLGLIASAAVLTAIGFGLVYGPLSPGIFFPAAFLVPSFAMALTLRLPHTLSDKGQALRARWEAYGRHLRERTGMHDAPPAGVAVWGDQLAYGAVLGVAPRTAEMLSPPE